MFLFPEHLRLTGCGNDATAFARNMLAPLIKPGMEVYEILGEVASLVLIELVRDLHISRHAAYEFGRSSKLTGGLAVRKCTSSAQEWTFLEGGRRNIPRRKVVQTCRKLPICVLALSAVAYGQLR